MTEPKKRFRVRWAEPWQDRPAKSMKAIEMMEGKMILQQFIMKSEEADALAQDILNLQ